MKSETTGFGKVPTHLLEDVTPTREELTCFRCLMVDRCVYAWDAYNTNGDCLGDK